MSFMLRKPPAFKEKLKRRSRRVEVLTVWVGFVAGISKIGSNNMLFGNNVEILKIIWEVHLKTQIVKYS